MTNTLPTFLPTSGGNVVPCFSIAGPLQIWANSGSAGAGQFLGWTRGGIEIQEQSFQTELKSDYSGGEGGPPGDFEWLGEQHTITAELAQYNPSVLAALERRMNASITTRVRGQLIGCSGGQFKILFIALNFVRCYTNVFITEPISYAPLGTAASFPRITFLGLNDNGNTDLSPWNSTGYTVAGASVSFS